MNKIALTALLCSITYALPHEVTSAGAPVTTQVAAVSQIGQVSHAPIFLELPFTTYLFSGRDKAVFAKTSTYRTTHFWNDFKQCYEATPLVQVSESVEPILRS